MKFNITEKIINLGLIISFAFLSFACQKPSTESVPTAGAQTPTEAYQMLYAAVKAKDTEKIKQVVSKETHGLAEFMAGRSNQPLAKSYENGFTATTFAAELPEIRDERVKDQFGAIEVYNQQDKRWEDLPFVKEGTGWKLAIGDVFKDTFKSPADPKSKIENEASNSAAGQMIPSTANLNGNSKVNSGSRIDKNKSIEVPVEPTAANNKKGKRVIDIQQVKKTLLQYERHGWNLRRVLLSAENLETLAGQVRKVLFGETEVIRANFDAAWFSRRTPGASESEAWELRSLSGTPFALIEVFEAEDDEEVREEARQEMEMRLGEQTSKKPVNR